MQTPFYDDNFNYNNDWQLGKQPHQPQTVISTTPPILTPVKSQQVGITSVKPRIIQQNQRLFLNPNALVFETESGSCDSKLFTNDKLGKWFINSHPKLASTLLNKTQPAKIRRTKNNS